MNASRLRPAPIAWLIAMLVIVASGWILLPFPRRPTGWEAVVWVIGFGVGFTTVGAILVDRRPREPVSRLTFAIGIAVIAAVALRAFAVWAEARPGPIPPVAVVAANLSGALQIVAFLAAGSFLLVRFPDGRHPGRLAGAVDVLAALIVGAAGLQLLMPGLVDVGWLSPVENPIGIPALSALSGVSVAVIGLTIYAVSAVLAVLEVWLRYRRADAVVRAQIRWVVAAAAIPMLLVPLISLVDWMWTVWFLSTILLPIAIGIAILRYRLFDIDRIIGRTIAYAAVTAILAAVFVTANLVLVRLFADATRSNTLVVAATTLLVAALFQPIRRRVQAPIDRRFNRAHHDGERVIARFARRTRDEVDLVRLRQAVVTAADEAIAPTTAALWLRQPGTRG
jgi:hypothetical protein